MDFQSQGQLMEAIIKTVPCPERINSIDLSDDEHVIFSHISDRFIVDMQGHVQQVNASGQVATTSMSQLFEMFLKRYKNHVEVY